jgi:carboxymethylenebutenolidase
MRSIALACFVLACSSSTKPADTKPTGPASTGPLSEAEFKALHTPPGTPPANLKGTSIDLGGSKAYLSLPAGPGPFPAIIVIHEWWGLNPHVEHYADRFAAAGWAALAVDLYSGVVATDRDAALAAMKAVDEGKAKQTLADAIAFVGSDPRIKATRRAVVGWCFGGAWSLQTGIAHPELDGVILYYGQLETDPAKLGSIKRLLGIFGTRDKGIPMEQVDKFEAALKEAKVAAEIKRYDAEHAFANPSNPKYDEASAGDAWKHVLAFLDGLTKG